MGTEKKRNVVIIESPNKIEKLKQIFGRDARIIATSGHIEEIADEEGYNAKSFGVSDDFMPRLQVMKSKEKTVDYIKTMTSSPLTQNIYLATDPDREGEAIAYSVYKHISPEARRKCKRITFNAITESDVLRSIKNARDIDMNLVHAQVARRVIDRLVGFGLSRVVGMVLGRGHSVGRVQTPALKMVWDRYINKELFLPEHYFDVSIIYDMYGSAGARSVYMKTSRRFATRRESDAFANSVSFPQRVVGIRSSTYSIPPKKPLTTTGVISESYRKYGNSSQQTMKAAQSLFSKGLVSYIRTDSVSLSDEARNMIRDFVENNLKDEYYDRESFVNDNPYAFGAHEAIRPTMFLSSPQHPHLTDDSLRQVYSLVMKRSVAYLMPDATVRRYAIDIESSDGNRHTAYADELERQGHLRVSGGVELPYPPLPYGLKKDMLIRNGHVAINKGETKPQPLHDDATLTEEMESSGCGRPSTYATMIEILKERGYINTDDIHGGGIGNYVPTDKAKKLIDLMASKYPRILDTEFTAKMESRLDSVARGESDISDTVKSTVDEFRKNGIDIMPNRIGMGGM